MAAETARARRAGRGNGRTGIAASTFAPASLATAVDLVVLREALLAHLADGQVRRMSGTDAKIQDSVTLAFCAIMSVVDVDAYFGG